MRWRSADTALAADSILMLVCSADCAHPHPKCRRVRLASPLVCRPVCFISVTRKQFFYFVFQDAIADVQVKMDAQQEARSAQVCVTVHCPSRQILN